MHRLTPDSPLDDYLVNYEYDIGFHHLLIKCSGNKLLMDLYQFLNPFLYINYVYNKQSKEQAAHRVQEHQEIMEASAQRERGGGPSVPDHPPGQFQARHHFHSQNRQHFVIGSRSSNASRSEAAGFGPALPARYQRFPSASKGHSRGSSRISIMGLARASSSIPSEISISSRRMVSRMWTIRGFARSM